jgi:hypothetical protein
MTRLAHALALLACAALAQAAAAGGAPIRQPIKGWVLDYGDTACTATRAFGTEAAPILLAFRPSPNGHVVRLGVARPGKGGPARMFPVATNIYPPKAQLSGLRFTARKHDLVWVNVERLTLDKLPAAGELDIRGEDEIDERFAVPGIAAVLKALDKCNEDLRRYWNVAGSEVVASVPAKPLKPLPEYFSDEDYPGQAIQEDAGGTSAVMLMIDESGTLKDCMVEQTSGIAVLDAMTCAVLLERAKFRPALDSAGKPVRSVFNTRVVWRMP